MEIEIKGIKYKQIEKQPRKPLSKGVQSLMMLAGVFGGLYGFGTTYTRKRPYVNIIKEFELIQNKKSKLPRNDRDWVVFKFHQNFEPA